ncbi:ribonuclease H-like superfamily protein [Striga asiatica]|uniref:Ribonuclease H-like superfamily protein n=1 Tax=Striga asiatica TaxID=4170 RepID=A0A5A7PEZ3_STRAF|nr:ribonuclease H-like superfamily protein [Striga asiatica]
MKHNLDATEFAIFASQVWGWWVERQRRLHYEDCDFGNEKSLNMVMDEVDNRSDIKWRKPPDGVWRLDVDVSWDDIEDLFAIGGIFRDSMGQLKVVFGRKKKRINSVLEGELLAIMEGIKIAKEKNLFPFM